MNAAFLLVTSALTVGQGGGPPPGQVIPPPAYKPVPVSSACNDCCQQEGFGHRLHDKLRALFQRDSRDCCQPTCQERPRFALFKGHCDNGCKPKIWNWQPHCLHQNRAPATCNDPCNRGGLNFLEKLRSKFHRNDACCEGGTAAPAYYPGKIETIPPRQMPKEAPKAGARFEAAPAPAPIAPNAVPAVPNAPNVEVAPAPAPAPILPATPPPAPPIPGGNRDPF